jgi:hypothetical protein
MRSDNVGRHSDSYSNAMACCYHGKAEALQKSLWVRAPPSLAVDHLRSLVNATEVWSKQDGSESRPDSVSDHAFSEASVSLG